MTRPKILLVFLGVVAAVVLGVWIANVEPARQRRYQREIAAMRPRLAPLRERLGVAIANDPRFEQARQDSAEVVLALSARVVTTLLEQVIDRYLDRVELDLRPNIDKEKEGDLEVDTPFGHITAGEWTVRVQVHEIQGTLSARAPTVTVAGANRLHVAIPAVVSEGKGSASLRFRWDSKPVINLVCRNFEMTQRVHGTILPQEHVVRGDLILTASGETIVADPDFPREKFPISMTLAPESWEDVRAELEKQNSLLKCGLLMKPDKVVEKLRALGARGGINIKLPRKFFRTIALPASVSRSVRILDSDVQLDVQPNQLRITPGVFWYSAVVRARRATAADSVSSDSTGSSSTARPPASTTAAH